MQTPTRINLFFVLLAAGMNIVPLGAQMTGTQSLGTQPKAAAAVAHPAYPGTDTPLGQAVAAVMADPVVARAHWGIAVTTLDGTPLYGLEEGKLFRPASNAKLYTTAAAMALLGPTSTVTTEVQGREPGAGGVIDGDVRLVSDGDANLSGMAFPYVPVAGETPPSATPLKAINDLVEQLVAKGVKRINGGVVTDDTRWAWEPYPLSWAIDDMVWGYGAPVSSLSVNDSEINITIRPGAYLGDEALVKQSPDVGFYKLDNRVKTVDKSAPQHIHVERAVGSRTVTLSGEIPANGKDVETLAVSDPPLFAAQALRAELTAHHIQVKGDARADEQTSAMDESFAKQSHEPVPLLPDSVKQMTQAQTCTHACPATLATHRSPSLAQDVMYTMKESQNLHAEMLLRRLGKAWGQEASGAQGVRVLRQLLMNIGLDGGDLVFFDGSGLSDHTMVTPRATAKLLSYAATQPWFAQWKSSLPVGGVDGTLAGRFKDSPLKGHVFAKTGTLGESRALSGYIDCASGQQVIFSVMVDNHVPGGSADRVAMDKILAAIAANE